ncbi:MAG: GNAT family N-acetyltransferase [Deltaproteobacteria bacterium]|nr:GNAT family N-acetyltransferase [Deltaproteobacteria bacterium]
MPHKNMQEYLQVDYDKQMSIVGIAQKGNTEKIVAEGRYAEYPDGTNHDMAFLVDEEFQGKGIATFMLNYLIKIAQERGVKALSASVLAQNDGMLKVFNRATVKPKKSRQHGIVELDFNLE